MSKSVTSISHFFFLHHVCLTRQALKHLSFQSFKHQGDRYLVLPCFLQKQTCPIYTLSNTNSCFLSGSKMQGLLRAVRYCHEHVHIKTLSYSGTGSTLELIKVFSHQGHITSSPSPPTKHHKGFKDESVAQSHTMSEKGLQNTAVAEVLMTKGEEKVGSWLWCRTDDTVYDAVKQMAQNNIGSLVVLKPGEQQLIAGIFTERDYLRKVIVQDRSSKYTKVGEIMTHQDKLITVTSDTNILHAMQLMTGMYFIDGKIVGMISIVDVVRAVLEQQHGEMKRLNEFIQGDYY
ncbi:hypothetical protein Pfo_021602 [Paulownia fortunei]|nr:hypothetical protein Pfo_021602 [Paulownia fortunei]